MKFILLDQVGNVLANGSADLTGYNFWEGIIETHTLPPDLLALCSEANEYMRHQVFHALDTVQDLVNDYNVNVRLEDGRLMRAKDLMLNLEPNGEFQIAWKNNETIGLSGHHASANRTKN